MFKVKFIVSETVRGGGEDGSAPFDAAAGGGGGGVPGDGDGRDSLVLTPVSVDEADDEVDVESGEGSNC